MYLSPEWVEVHKKGVEHGLGDGFMCGDWPAVGEKCHTCGKVSNG